MLKIKRKKQLKNRKKNNTNNENSTQYWLPIIDVNNNYIYTKNNFLIAALEINPINMDLKSQREKTRIIKNFHEVMNGQQEYLQIISLSTPVDLDKYILELENKICNTENYARKKLLQASVRKAANMATSGETLERKFYIIITQKKDDIAKQEIQNRITELSSKLKGAELESKICSNKELIQLLFMFTHPVQAAYERAPTDAGPYLPTQYESEG